MTTFSEINQKREDLFNLIKEQGKAALEQEFEAVFSKLPHLLGIQWAQYTPGFNDGDPCEFSLTPIAAYFTSEELEEGDFYDVGDNFSWGDYEPNDNYSKEDREFLVTFFKALEENEELLEYTYGNDQEIKVTRTETGVKIETGYYECGY